MGDTTAIYNKRQKHNIYQQRVFKKNVDFFRQTIPEEIERRTERIVAVAKLRPSDRVLDVGTGTGVLIPHIQRYGVRYIVGCDLSPEMLAEAARRFPDIHFWCGDVIEIPSQLGPFDAVFFNAMFGNVWDQRDTLITTSTHLAPNGRIIISHPMGASFTDKLMHQDPQLVPHSLPTQNQLADLIQGLPLKVQHFDDEEQLYLCLIQHVAS